MLAKSFTCPKCGTKTTTRKIQENNFACINSRCPLRDRLVAHADLNANGKVTKIYGWVLERGTILNQRYLILKLLGKGGFGATYLAKDRKMFDKICAIKETPILYFDEQEEEFLTRLDHPAIPKLLERFNINGLHYSVMEYFEGNGLETLVSKSKSGLPEATVLKLAEPIFNVLSYIHSQKVIHRDLKPENILVGKDNSIALIDFGIAKQYDVGKGTRRLARAASCFYSSPEQYQAGKGYTDVKSDVYSFGAILYFLLTGKEPVDALSRTASRDIEPKPRQLNLKISAHVEKVILKAMKMRKQDRYASIPQMKKALFRKKNSVESTCNKCGVTLKEPGNFCPNCGHSTNQLSEKPLEPFIFRSGDRALNVQQFVQKCYSRWEDAKWHLLRGDFIDWLSYQQEKTLLRKARQFKNRKTDPDILLNEFLATSKFGGSPQLEINQNKFEFQKAAQGKVISGELKLSNKGKGLLKGELKSGAKWLKLSAKEFACNGGEKSAVSFSIQTKSLAPERNYSTKITVNSNVKNIEIPVTVSVILPPAQLKIEPGRLYFQVKPGKSITAEILVQNCGNNEVLNWQAGVTQKWIQVKPVKFKAKARKIRVEISAKNLPEGKYSGQIRITTMQKTLLVPVDLLVTSAARNSSVTRSQVPPLQEILQPIFSGIIISLIIGHFGANPAPRVFLAWPVLLLAAIGGFYGIRQSLFKTIAGILTGAVLGLFWETGLHQAHQLIFKTLMEPIYQLLTVNLTPQQFTFSWALLGLYFGGVIGLIKIFVTMRKWWAYFLLGLAGFTLFVGMAFLGLPYIISG